MNNSDPNLSRLNRKKRRRGDKILNALIAVVVVAIIITASIIFTGGGKEKANEDHKADNKEQVEQFETAGSDEDEAAADEEDNSLSVEEENEEGAEDAEDDLAEDESGEVEITVDPDNKIVSQSIVDPSWEPIGTEQSGEHVSLYDGKSTDWQEKEKALSYATGLSPDNMIIWKIKNGGSPQKSIGIVSSMDKAEMYQVYLEWVDQQGWKPVKMDVLTTLNFNY